VAEIANAPIIDYGFAEGRGDERLE